MQIELDPQLLEDVVFLEINRLEKRGDEAAFREYRDRVDALYDLPHTDDDREIAFRDVHAEFFEKLGLEQRVRNSLDEFPLLKQKLERLVCLKAVSHKEEGADLFIRRDDGESADQHRVAVLRLRPEVFMDTKRMSFLLRHELYHISDMVDPAFDYEPDIGGVAESPGHENLIRDRYRVLWNLYIDTRLVTAGRAPSTILQQGRSMVEKAFGGFDDQDIVAMCAKVSDTRSLSHGELLTMAREDLSKIRSGPGSNDGIKHLAISDKGLVLKEECMV